MRGFSEEDTMIPNPSDLPRNASLLAQELFPGRGELPLRDLVEPRIAG
jgi:hypothetical protein